MKSIEFLCRHLVKKLNTNNKIGPHDLGGDEAGEVPRASHELQWWEKRIDALYKLLADEKRQLLKVDELRFAIESLGEEAYHQHSYYERWTLAIHNLLIDKKILTAEEISARVGELKKGREA